MKVQHPVVFTWSIGGAKVSLVRRLLTSVFPIRAI